MMDQERSLKDWTKEEVSEFIADLFTIEIAEKFHGNKLCHVLIFVQVLCSSLALV